MRYLLALLVVPMMGQTTATLTATVASSKSFILTLRPKTDITALTCDPNDPEPGEITTCTVTLNQAPRVNKPISANIVIPAGFTGPTSVSIVAPATTTTFTLTRNEIVATNRLRWTGAGSFVKNTSGIGYHLEGGADYGLGVGGLNTSVAVLDLKVDGQAAPSYTISSNSNGCLKVLFSQPLRPIATIDGIPLLMSNVR